VISSHRSYAAWPDNTLLAALRADDREAFAEIFQRYSSRLFEVAYAKLKGREAAEELVQELFENLWFKRGESQILDLEHYLFSAIKYRVINQIKSRKVREGYAAYCRIRHSEAVETTQEIIALQDLNAALVVGMEQLPEKSREIFRLSRLEQYTVPEIALRFNLTPKAVEYHLTRSLKLLRVYLKDFLVSIMFLLLWS
jgi:RNA polymerase sigma-70 factor (family 1)